MKKSQMIVEAALKMPNTNMQSTQLAMLAAILDALEDIKEEIRNRSREAQRYSTSEHGDY